MNRQRKVKRPGTHKTWSMAGIIKKRAGPTPNRTVLSEHSQRARSLPIPWLEAKFKDQGPSLEALCAKWKDIKPLLAMPETGYQIPEEEDNCPPFVRAYLKYMDIMSGAEPKRCITLHSNATETWLLYHQDNTHWIVMKDSLLEEVKRSHNFSSSKMAIYAFKRKHIHWLISLSSKELPKED